MPRPNGSNAIFPQCAARDSSQDHTDRGACGPTHAQASISGVRRAFRGECGGDAEADRLLRGRPSLRTRARVEYRLAVLVDIHTGTNGTRDASEPPGSIGLTNVARPRSPSRTAWNWCSGRRSGCRRETSRATSDSVRPPSGAQRALPGGGDKHCREPTTPLHGPREWLRPPARHAAGAWLPSGFQPERPRERRRSSSSASSSRVGEERVPPRAARHERPIRPAPSGAAPPGLGVGLSARVAALDGWATSGSRDGGQRLTRSRGGGLCVGIHLPRAGYGPAGEGGGSAPIHGSVRLPVGRTRAPSPGPSRELDGSSCSGNAPVSAAAWPMLAASSS
jgi:hypothetical protein